MIVRIHTNYNGNYLSRFEGLETGERPPWSALTFFGWLQSDLQFNEDFIEDTLKDFEDDGAATSNTILLYSGNAYEIFIHSGLCFLQLEPYLDQVGQQRTVVSLIEVKRALGVVVAQIRAAEADDREPEIEFDVDLLAEGQEAIDMFRKHCGDPEWDPSYDP